MGAYRAPPPKTRFWEAYINAPLIRGVPPFWALFGDLGIFGENGVPYWPPRQCKPAEKTVHLPSGVISEVPPPEGQFCTPCVSRAQIDPRGGDL